MKLTMLLTGSMVTLLATSASAAFVNPVSIDDSAAFTDGGVSWSDAAKLISGTESTAPSNEWVTTARNGGTGDFFASGVCKTSGYAQMMTSQFLLVLFPK